MENKAIIYLFSEQLKNEINKIIQEKELDNNGQALIWWYFKKLYPLSDDDIEDSICDGGGDLGVDAIYKDDYGIVHFYQFKNPLNPEKYYPAGEVDKTISGLELIIRRMYHKIANENIKEKIAEVLETIPRGYQLHFVSTGAGLEVEAQTKLYAFILSLNPPTKEFLKYTDENISYLQDLFYTKSLPTLKEDINLVLENTPYMVRSANHESYIFHLEANYIAEIYEKYGEKILQQNIRMFEGENATNEAIYRSCIGDDSENFYHYNNGISILCENAKWDAFAKTITLHNPQIVNGGQTLRVLHKAKKDDVLKPKVIVPIRVITSQGDKNFAGNVAVNLNNQTKVEGSFLKSNNPRIVQLATSLLSLGWYLERRDNEVEGLEESDKAKIELAINGKLSERTIPLKEGTQAYVASFYENPGLARKDPIKMFLDTSEGGHFIKIFDLDLTADNFAKAFILYKKVEEKIREFKLSIRKKKKKDPHWKAVSLTLFDEEFIDENISILEQIVPQSTIFVVAVCYQWYIVRKNYTFEQLIQRLDKTDILTFVFKQILVVKESYGEELNKSWQTLLKSQDFFLYIKSHLDVLRSKEK